MKQMGNSGPILFTLSAASDVENVMKPKPRDRPVSGSVLSVQSTTSPNLAKYSRMSSANKYVFIDMIREIFSL